MKIKLQILGLVSMAMLLITPSSANAQDKMGMKSGMGMMSSMDQKFMMMAAQGGMSEIEMARMALQKSSNDAVKQYAQKMIDDHTMAGDELKQLASAKGVMLSMDADKQMAMMAKMQKMSSMDFDMMYVKDAGVKAHQDMEKLFMKESMSGKDMEAKAFAAKTLPTVRMHLQMARELMMHMKGMKGMKNNMSGMKSSGN